MNKKQNSFLDFLLQNRYHIDEEELLNYKNQDSVVAIACPNGHAIKKDIRTLLNTDLECIWCLKEQAQKPASKKPYLIALDAATHTSGVAFFSQEGQLQSSQLFKANRKKSSFDRIIELVEFVENKITKEGIRVVCIEDVQNQNNNQVFKMLTILQGIMKYVVVHKHNKELIIIPPQEWRSYHNMGAGKREEMKQKAIERVCQIYGKELTDDEAESVLLGAYAMNKIKK